MSNNRKLPEPEQFQGKLYERYLIYKSCAESTGEYVLTFDEWLNS